MSDESIQISRSRIAPEAPEPLVEKQQEDLVEDNDDVLISDFACLSIWESIKKFRYATLITVLAGSAACSDGFQYTIPGNIIANQGFIQQFGSRQADGSYVLDAYHIAAWGGVLQGSTIAMLLVGTWPTDIFGRKFGLALLQVVLVLGIIIELVSKDWRMWLVAKIFAGFGIALAQSVVTIYLSEVAPTRLRGAVLGAYQLWFAFGQLMAAIALQVLAATRPLDWRRAIQTQWVVVGLSLLIWLFLLPESPRWLAAKGKHEKAKRVLKRIYGSVPDYNLDKEYAILLQEVADADRLTAHSAQQSILDCFRGTNLRRTLISTLPFAWQQWIGSPVVFSYSTYYFQLAGLKNPFNGTVAVFVILVSFVAGSFYTTERLGRRNFLLCGGLICIICLLIEGGVATMPTGKVTGGVIVAFNCLWVASYALTCGPLGYVFLGECSTVILRAKTTGVAACFSASFNLINTYCLPLLLSPTAANWGVKGVSFFYAGTGAMGLVLVYFFVPETKSRSFIELDELFERKVSARKFANTKVAGPNAA